MINNTFTDNFSASEMFQGLLISSDSQLYSSPEETADWEMWKIVKIPKTTKVRVFFIFVLIVHGI